MGKRKLPKGDQTRLRILQAAMDLVAKHGVEGASFQMIADACDISQSGVLHHFGSKLGLIEAMVENSVRSNHEFVSVTMKPEDGAETRLFKHGIGNVKWAAKHKAEARVIVLLYHLASFDKRFQKLYLTILETARARIREHLLAGVRENAFKLKDTAFRVSELLHDALFGAFVFAILAPEQFKLEEFEKKWLLAIKLLA